VKEMFKKMHNIETAFQYIRSISLVVITGIISLCGFIIYQSYKLANHTQEKIYVLVNGKALEAYASERKDNIHVEARDHIKMFVTYFFTLSPDDKAIEENITKALYLADGTAKVQYDNLKESNYYANIISGNVNQTVKVDSIIVNTNQIPFYFRCYATQVLTRPTSIVTRNLITQGYLRNVERSENNSHGLLIERWNIIENKDLTITNR
jgi:conjugative transposon TraK protein